MPSPYIIDAIRFATTDILIIINDNIERMSYGYMMSNTY